MNAARKQSPNSDAGLTAVHGGGERGLTAVHFYAAEAAWRARDAAQALLAPSFDPSDLQRMQHLAASAQAGDLTEEADHYERVGHLLGLLRSKARRVLQATPASAA